MTSHEDLLAELPANHPDEPGSLRSDIADELLDHLESAARREAVSESDPAEIQRRVLKRFGDPRKIARKLWFDAMKEKLMTQKITLVVVSLVAAAALTVCGLMWGLAQDFQAAALKAQEASTEMLAQGRDVNERLLEQNQEMMAQLTTLANRPEKPANDPSWIPLSIEVVKDNAEGSPGVGFRAEVSGHVISDKESVTLSEKTGEDGKAEFGLVRPGKYSLNIYTPWGEHHYRPLLVKPGGPQTITIKAPAGPPKAITVKPTVNWPEELKGKDIAILAKVSRADATMIDQSPWYPRGSTYLLIRPDGRFATYPELQFDNASSYGGYGRRVSENLDEIPVQSDPEIHKSTFSWNGEEAGFSQLSIVQLSADAEFPKAGEALARIAPSDELDRIISGTLNWPEPVRKAWTIGPEGVLFTIKATGADVEDWTIDVPSPLILLARSQFEAEKFPELSIHYARPAVLSFYLMDADKNGELSKEELKSNAIGRQFPFEDDLPFKDYVTTFVETRGGTR